MSVLAERGCRDVPAANFFLGYRTVDMKPDEILLKGALNPIGCGCLNVYTGHAALTLLPVTCLFISPLFALHPAPLQLALPDGISDLSGQAWHAYILARVAWPPWRLLVTLPFTRKYEYVKEFKQAPRREDDIAIVNAGMRIRMEQVG
eukprot:1147322-Pelagomonas_calceolata.AAC.1